MAHQDKVKKLNRPKPHREAMLANMATSLFENRMIQTTDARAKELRRIVDRLISIAKKDNLSSRRQVARTIRNKQVFKKLFNEIVPQFSNRSSGFTRVLKVGPRRGDNAAISVVELLTEKPKESKEGAKKGSKKKSKAESA
jgi:large subunit ribosomal protein L17